MFDQSPPKWYLPRRPSLEQQPRHIVEHEDRDGEVEHPGRPVHFELVGGAGWAPVRVDEDDLIHDEESAIRAPSGTADPIDPNIGIRIA